jgi:hypothetical protein
MSRIRSLLGAGAVTAASLLFLTGAPAQAGSRPAGQFGSPRIGGDAALFGVTCPSLTYCQAAGYFYAGGDVSGLVEAEISSSHFGYQGVAGLQSQDDVQEALAISCGGVDNCMIVGQHQASGGRPVRFADIIGTVWTPVQWNNPPGAESSSLDDVSCPVAGNCLAVGEVSQRLTKTTASIRPLALDLRAGSWRLLPSPRVQDAGLSGVSCPDLGSCVAVGEQAGGTPIADRWRGGQWTALKPARTSGNRSADALNRVSCVSDSHCVAVGFRYDLRANFSDATLIETWTGHFWRIDKSVNP